jgi:hypothetical protein
MAARVLRCPILSISSRKVAPVAAVRVFPVSQVVEVSPAKTRSLQGQAARPGDGSCRAEWARRAVS